jgi:catechol 2,3-dioxygenase-like lactoylglutathione lyase family enzyme
VPDELVNVRYMVDDVESAVAFYTTHFGFTLRSSAAPAFADVVRGNLRLLLSGPASSAGRPMPDGRTPQPGGWNRHRLHRRRYRGRGRAAAFRRTDVPQRHRQRAGRPADPARGPRWQPDRAVSAGGRIAAGSGPATGARSLLPWSCRRPPQRARRRVAPASAARQQRPRRSRVRCTRALRRSSRGPAARSSFRAASERRRVSA